MNARNLLSVVLLFALVPVARAQNYPVKAIRWIVSFPPGGGADTLSRMLSPRIAEALGQQIIIDNRSGAGGNIGAEIAAKSPADGYTILFAFLGTHAINPSIYSKMPFQENDFTPIIWNASSPLILVVHPSLPAKSVPELIAIANSRPDQLIYGSTGAGAHNHLAAELFKMMTHTRMVHVPYKGGGPAMMDTIAGQAQINMASLIQVIPHAKSGKLRLLATSGTKRSALFPDVPTVAETVPGYDATNWWGLIAPAGTPQPVIAKLSSELEALLRSDETRKRVESEGADVIRMTPAEFGRFISEEMQKWAKVVKQAGIQAE